MGRILVDVRRCAVYIY